MYKILTIFIIMISTSIFGSDQDPSEWIFSQKGKEFLFSKTFLMLKEQNRLYSTREVRLQDIQSQSEYMRVSSYISSQFDNITIIDISSNLVATVSANTNSARTMGLKSIYKLRDESLVYKVKIKVENKISDCIGRISVYEYRNDGPKKAYPGFYVALGACKTEGQSDSSRSNIGAFFDNIINYTQVHAEKNDFTEWLTLKH